ncbi:hypothetical protein ANO11243_076630 [Dothideomycetidae sp. 11243]|nr:hypothetical protein ANO11243_076630 [fungal sp. No.11243]
MPGTRMLLPLQVYYGRLEIHVSATSSATRVNCVSLVSWMPITIAFSRMGIKQVARPYTVCDDGSELLVRSTSPWGLTAGNIRARGVAAVPGCLILSTFPEGLLMCQNVVWEMWVEHEVHTSARAILSLEARLDARPMRRVRVVADIFRSRNARPTLPCLGEEKVAHLETAYPESGGAAPQMIGVGENAPTLAFTCQIRQLGLQCIGEGDRARLSPAAASCGEISRDPHSPPYDLHLMIDSSGYGSSSYA